MKGCWLNFDGKDVVLLKPIGGNMGGKGSGAPVAYPGAKLAKGWQETPQREKDKEKADRYLFTFIHTAMIDASKGVVYHIMMELARKWVCLATLEEVRALTIELEEYKL